MPSKPDTLRELQLWFFKQPWPMTMAHALYYARAIRRAFKKAQSPAEFVEQVCYVQHGYTRTEARAMYNILSSQTHK